LYLSHHMNTINKSITVAVGMSGGVDSSVAAALLVEQGYSVIGLTMKTYDFMEVGGSLVNESNCCDLNAVKDANAVARKLGIPHYVINVRDEFNKSVIDNFVDEYLHGRTPNPCVICNREIKFGLLLEKAQEHGAQFFATGHYARVRYDENRKRYILSKGKYLEKDQSYALWALTQESLSKIIFPIGEKTKQEVRLLAEQFGLVNAKKHESYEICFVADDQYDRFLNDRIPDLKQKVAGGNILYKGKEVGKHLGYPFYTIGQRRNIGAHGQKMYVTGINYKSNEITIGPDSDLHQRVLIAGKVNWSGMDTLVGERTVQAKVRYKDDTTNATLTREGEENIKVTFHHPKRAITPGQSVVIYENDDVLCGGVIEKILE